MAATSNTPKVGILMGSKSDWPTMQHTALMLDSFGVEYEAKVLSAHRTPDQALEYAAGAQARGISVLICAAGGAAHLAGVVAAKSILPVLAVPMEGWALKGLDALLAMVQMPAGIPVGTLAIGKHGAKNAALLAVSILAGQEPELAEKLHAFRASEAEKILSEELPAPGSV